MSEVLSIDFVNSSSNFRVNRDPSLISETLSLIGPSYKGPAFVPTLVNEFFVSSPGLTLNTFENIFGEETKNSFETPKIANIWLTSGGQQLSYTRVLGIGDGTGVDEVTGIVNGSGFVVGKKTVCDSIIPGKIGDNNKAQRSGLGHGEDLALGRTFFYCNKYMNVGYSSKAFSGYESNMYGNLHLSEHFYLVDKVFLTQQGVYLTLDRTYDNNSYDRNTDGVIDSDSMYPTVFKKHTRSQDLKDFTVKSDSSYGTAADNYFGGFITTKTQVAESNSLPVERICINGLSNNEYINIPNILKFSNYSYYNKNINYYNDTVGNSDYFINKDFKRLNDRGYVEYCNFKFKEYVYQTSVQIILPSKLQHNQVFIDPHTPENSIPSYEDFQSTFKKAKTPWVVSQHLYGWSENDDTLREEIDKKCIDLFRFHACDDGEIGNRFRIRIKPRKLGVDSARPEYFDLESNKIVSKDIWSTFDISVKEYNHKINSFTEIMYVSNVDLNPDSQNYICRLFGTKNTYFDLENNKIVDEGFYDKTNQYLFVEVHPDVEDKLNSCTLMPSGFHSYPHINISNNCLLDEALVTTSNIIDNDLRGIKIFQKPVNYIRNLNYQTTSRRELLFDNSGNPRTNNKGVQLSVNRTYGAGNIDTISQEEYYWGVKFNNENQRVNNDELYIRLPSFNLKIVKNTFYYVNMIRDSKNFRQGNTELSPYYDYTKWFQNSRSDINVWVEDKNYLNSFFHLEKILYMKDAISLVDKYRFASYRRDGKSIAEIKAEHVLRFKSKATITIADNAEALHGESFTVNDGDNSQVFVLSTGQPNITTELNGDITIGLQTQGDAAVFLQNSELATQIFTAINDALNNSGSGIVVANLTIEDPADGQEFSLETVDRIQIEIVTTSNVSQGFSFSQTSESIIDLFKYININDVLKVEGSNLESSHSEFLKFDFFTYGGFDGVNCFDYDKKLMNNDAMIRELEDEDSNGFYQGPTYNMYSKALGIATQYENTDCDILSLPGITHPKFLREVYDITEEKDRFISLVDIPKLDSASNFITGSLFEESYEDNENSKLSSDFSNNRAGEQIIKVIDTGTTSFSGDIIYTDISEIIEEGTVNTFNFFNKFNFENSNIFAAYNDLIIEKISEDSQADGSYENKFTLPATALTVNALAKTYNNAQINIDTQSDNISTNNTFDFTDVLNLNLINESNEKDSLLRLSESYGINVIGRKNLTSSLSFNSANSLKEDRRSIFRSIHNVRVLNKIKKRLKFSIYGALGDDILLFENNFLRNNVYRKLETVINDTLSFFVSTGELQGFNVILDNNSLLNTNPSNTISCKILLTFFGKNINDNLTNLEINNIISNIDQLIESFNENIVIVRT